MIQANPPLTTQESAIPCTRDVVELALLAGAALTFYAAPWPVAYLPALAALVVLTWRRLDLALWLVVGFAPAFMVTKHIGSREFSPSEIFLWIDVGIVAARAISTSALDVPDLSALRRSPFLIPGMLFLCAGTLSAIFATDHAEAFRAWRLVIFEPLVFFVLLLLVERSLPAWVTGFGVLIAAGVAASGIAIGQFVTRRDLSTTAGSSLLRAKALYGSPDNLGLFLDRVIPVWLAWLLFYRMKSWWRVIWMAAGLILVGGLIVTFSRGAWLAVAVACLALAATRARGRWIAIGAIVVVGATVAYRGPQTVQALRSGHSNTVRERGYLWESALRMIRDHPIVGIGPDNFLHYYSPRYDKYPKCASGLGYISPHALDQPCLSHPHNEVLDLWLSTGVLGLLAFAWLQVVFWRQSLVAYAREKGITRLLLAGSMAAMLAALIHGLVDNSYFLEDLGLVFWMLCGYVSFAVEREGTP